MLKLITPHYRDQDGLVELELTESTESFDPGDHLLVTSAESTDPGTLVVLRQDRQYVLDTWNGTGHLFGVVVARLKKFT